MISLKQSLHQIECLLQTDTFPTIRFIHFQQLHFSIGASHDGTMRQQTCCLAWWDAKRTERERGRRNRVKCDFRKSKPEIFYFLIGGFCAAFFAFLAFENSILFDSSLALSPPPQERRSKMIQLHMSKYLNKNVTLSRLLFRSTRLRYSNKLKSHLTVDASCASFPLDGTRASSSSSFDRDAGSFLSGDNSVLGS